MEVLTVTCIKPMKIGFLEIYGHKKPEFLTRLDDEISSYQPHLKKMASQSELHRNLQFDTIYLALSAGKNKYHRCIVREKRSNNKAMIELIDYGSNYEVDTSLLLELDPKHKTAEFLQEFPPIATKYILANFFCNWKLNERDIIDSLLSKSRLPITNEQKDHEQRFISLDYNGVDVATKLINSHVGMDISFTEQRIEVRKLTQSFEIFPTESGANGAGSPARREKRRNLVATRPLQMPSINNNIITNQGKQLIQNYILPKKSGNNTPAVEEPVDVNTQHQQPINNRKSTFTASELAPGNFHVVYCSYVENGPNEFYIQLKSQEHVLDRMQNDLANAPRVQLMSKMAINMSCIGMACVARFSEDHMLYRAVIHKVHTNGCRVIFVDYGNSELVSLNELYEIPLNFLNHRTFAMPFELHGCKHLHPIDDRLKTSFEKMIENETLELSVIASKNSPAQQCELFLSNGKNILDLLIENKNEFNSFSAAPHLQDGEYAMIRSVVSAKKFYVQRVNDTPAFDRMMDLLFADCNNKSKMTKLPSKNECCAAMHFRDNDEWYRAKVIDRIDNEHVKVLLVDFGHEMKCHLSQLREIKPEFMELPCQVIECCLADFVDVTDAPESTRSQMELLIDDSDKVPIAYKVILRKRIDNTYVVDLFNEKKDLHVSLSIYKLAMPRRPYASKSMNVSKATEVDKPSKIAPMNRNTTWPNVVRECDGAEHFEKFQEPIERHKERFDRNKDTNDDASARYERVKQSKPRNIDNQKQSTNSPPKNYQNRSEFDNRRTGDINKKPILQKHIIPRFNKRPNRSRNNHNGKRTIGLDKNDNCESSGNAESSGSTVMTSKSPEKVNNNNNKPIIPSITTEDFVGFNPTLPDAIPVPLNSTTKVNLVDWRSPLEFYVQLKSTDAKFDEMMYQIQKYYRKRATVQKKVPIDSLVMVRHKADSVIKRARIVDYNEPRDKYRVQFIDYGAKALCQSTDMFEMEKSFIRLPVLAIRCTLGDVILNKSVLEVHNKVHNIINNVEDIECTFVGKDHEKNTVDMIVNGKNLKNTLIQDKLLTNLPKDICLERLVGQTLTVYITAIADLSRFQVMFHGCDIAFMCSYKDLSIVKKNPQLSDHFRTFETNYVNVKVESIAIDNVLAMSVYLPQLDEDKNLPDICSYPIFSNEFMGIVSHAEPPYVVFVQNLSYDEQLQKLLDEMYAAYENDASVSPTTLNPNQTYASLSTDGNYYRCQFEKMYDNDKVIVRWIDYGNMEIVERSCVKQLQEQFKSPSSFARKMFIPIKFTNENTSILNLDWTTEKKVKILGAYKTHFVCDLLSNGSSLLTSLVDDGNAINLSIQQLEEYVEATEKDQKQVDEAPVHIETEQPLPPEQLERQQTAPQIELQHTLPQADQLQIPPEAFQDQLPPEIFIHPDELTAAVNAIAHLSIERNETPMNTDRELVFVTHVDNPNCFYIQLNSDSDAIEDCQQALQIVAPSLPALVDFRAGQLCIGKYSFDGNWYRARIIDTDGEITSILFIDYGNTDSITDNSLLKTIDSSLTTKEPFAMKCSLPIEPRGRSEWSESACSKLQMLVNDSPMEYELVSKDKHVNYVKLFFVGGRDLVKELIQEEVADPLEIIKSGEKCFVSHINSLEDFFIQVDSDTDALKKIETYLNNDNDSTYLNSAPVGTICSAKFEDGQFYRARILSILSESKGYDVEFLDYGNTFQTMEVRSLSPEITQLPHLRKRCNLKLPDNVQDWSEEAQNEFRAISCEGATEFMVNLIKPGKSACIELYTGDQNMADVLGKLCEKRQETPVVVDEQDDVVSEMQQHSINISDFPSGKQPCVLTHLNSPADFFVQFVSKSEDLNAIQAELANSIEQDDMESKDILIGSIVAALYPEDDYYYRAKVLDKMPHGISVFFIDYGNTCTVTTIRKLSSILSTIVPVAVNCSLARDRLDQFTSSDTDHFMGFMSEVPEPTFQIEAITTTANKSTVTFYRDDKEILDFIREIRAENTVNTENAVATAVLSDIIKEACAADEKHQ